MFSFSLYTETERTGIAPGRQGDGISNELICLAPKFYAKISTQLTRERERERERDLENNPMKSIPVWTCKTDHVKGAHTQKGAQARFLFLGRPLQIL
jgi:hypothetical protein